MLAQRRPERPYTVLPPGAPEAAGAAEASPDEATADEPAANAATAGEDAADEVAAGEDAADEVAEGDPARDTAGPSPAGVGEADDTGVTATRSDD